MERGYFKLWRKWFDDDSPIWANDSLIRIAVWCGKKASHKKRIIPFKTGKGSVEVELQPGQLIFGRHKAAGQLFMNPNTVWKRINKLKTLGFLTIESNNQYSIISICNYKEMQEPIKHTSNSGSTKQRHSKDTANNTKDTLDNDDKENNTITPREIFNLWNKYAVNGIQPLKALTSVRIDKIKTRLKENDNIDYWIEVFSKLSKIPYFLGQNKYDWWVDFNYVMKNDNNHIRIFEQSVNKPTQPDHINDQLDQLEEDERKYGDE